MATEFVPVAATFPQSSIEAAIPRLPNVTKGDSSTVPAPVSAVTDPLAEACANVTPEDIAGDDQDKSLSNPTLDDVTAPEVLARKEATPESISPRQALAIDLLLAGFSIAETAARVGVSRQTVYRWRYNHPRFMSIYGRLTREMSEQAGHRAEQLVYQALDIVQKTLTAKSSPNQVNAAIRLLSALRISRFAFNPSTPTRYRDALDHLIRIHRADEGVDPKAPIDDYERNDWSIKLADDNKTEISSRFDLHDSPVQAGPA